MGWSEIRDADGKVIGSVHICGRGQRRKPCSYPNCPGIGTRLCDAPVVRKGVAGTCDAAICATHAWHHEGKDLCPPHRKYALGAAEALKAPPAAPPDVSGARAPGAEERSPEDERALKSLLANGVARADALEMLGGSR
jgi:hypothetical protein